MLHLAVLSLVFQALSAPEATTDEEKNIWDEKMQVIITDSEALSLTFSDVSTHPEPPGSSRNSPLFSHFLQYPKTQPSIF